MTVSQALERLAAYEKQAFAYNHASGVLYYDGATVAPKARQTSGPTPWGTVPHELHSDHRPGDGGDAPDPGAGPGPAGPRHARKVSELWRDYEQTHRIPQEEFVAYQQLVSKADAVWHEAKERSDYACLSRISSGSSTAAAAWRAAVSRSRTMTYDRSWTS